MTHSGSFAVRSIGRRGVLLLAALAVSIGMYAAIAAGPVTKAQAGGEYFCYSNVGPWVNCFSSNARWLTVVGAFGSNHGACSNGWKDGFVTNWGCGPAGSWNYTYFAGNRYMLGVVRNNSANNNQIWGYQEYL